MDEAAARARIERLTAHDVDPILDTADIDDLVGVAKSFDSLGRLPTDPEWEPTWDIYKAAAAGWDIKAGRAAGDFRFEEDNAVFHREQVFRHCSAMSQRYRRSAVQVPMTAVSALEVS
jgi:hypothetical protein